MTDQVQKILEIADDELILGWRNSEWTGIAPLLEEDVAFSSIAQNEIGHARALYERAAQELGTTADELAFDRSPEEYRCSYLYETADEERIGVLKQSEDAELAGLAAKIDREEAYHRMHAQMWFERLHDEPRFKAALDELQPLLDVRGEHTPEFATLWEEMTSVRRSLAGATW